MNENICWKPIETLFIITTFILDLDLECSLSFYSLLKEPTIFYLYINHLSHEMITRSFLLQCFRWLISDRQRTLTRCGTLERKVYVVNVTSVRINIQCIKKDYVELWRKSAEGKVWSNLTALFSNDLITNYCRKKRFLFLFRAKNWFWAKNFRKYFQFRPRKFIQNMIYFLSLIFFFATPAALSSRLYLPFVYVIVTTYAKLLSLDSYILRSQST